MQNDSDHRICLGWGGTEHARCRRNQHNCNITKNPGHLFTFFFFYFNSFFTFHRAETFATIEKAQRGSGERQVSGPRAEFWKLRGLRGNKKNEKNVRRTRDDLLQLTIQGNFPAYERVLLREGLFSSHPPFASQLSHTRIQVQYS